MTMWTHQVSPGETLSQLAIEYQSSIPDIVKASGLPNPNWIIPGRKLLIPGPDFAYTKAVKEKWTELLFEGYASPLSKLTSLTQYAYQYTVWNSGSCKEIIYAILHDELEHLNIIAQILMNLGVEPRYWSGCGKYAYWEAECINYSSNPAEMLECDLALESFVLERLTNISDTISDRLIKYKLAPIIRDEHKHQKLLADMQKKLIHTT